MEKVFIYFLEKNGCVFYIGRTKDVEWRFICHMNKYGEDVSLIVLDEVDKKDATFWEAHYIWMYRYLGFDLINKSLFTSKRYFNKKTGNVKKINKHPLEYRYNNKINKDAAQKWLKENKPFKNKL